MILVNQGQPVWQLVDNPNENLSKASGKALFLLVSVAAKLVDSVGD